MHRTPNPPHILILTDHFPTTESLVFVSTIHQQHVRLLHHLLVIHVLDAYRFFTAVDVVRLEDWMTVGTGRDAKFDAGMGGGERGE